MLKTIKAWPGQPYPLGATWQNDGVNFALYSENATAVELCLFEHADASIEQIRIPMTEHTDQVWHVFLPDVLPGQLYGYRVQGPYEPDKGLRFNASKLLIDPYAKAIAGAVSWSDEMFGYTIGDQREDYARDYRNDAWGVPKSVVIDTAFEWGDDKPPLTPLNESVIYEVHVKGFSKLSEAVPEEMRGSYAALGSDFAIDYFKRLGITAVELLPVHQHIDDKHLVDRKLRNYWGYNTIGFFAPECSYSSSGVHGEQVNEFRSMVKKLHAAGIEVILDVVYNHTAEGNHLGPTLSFRGIDNTSYYRLTAQSGRYYQDYTGTGNTLNVLQPRVLQLIMDSLRYWVLEMHVDGFRFDLASALARELHEFGKLSAFFDIIHQDPVLSRVKLIAEPWDVGEGGYQVGNFPVLWAEWNGKYRDAIRHYWKGDEGHVGDLAYRLSGSSDLYQSTGKRPYASINFITAHDGYTLDDLVSYNDKHNDANGEENRDGDNNNASWNCGAEGHTDDEEINKLRRRQRRNFLATLFLSQGVPMLCGGDEFGRTQNGNNNAYCQDNEISWYPWDAENDGSGEAAEYCPFLSDEHARRLARFTSRLIGFRKEHPVFRRPKFFQGRHIRGSDVKDIMWFATNGEEMNDEAWSTGFIRCLGMMLCGDTLDVRDAHGQPVIDDSFLLLTNAHHEPVPFTLPGEANVQWDLLLNTDEEDGFLGEHSTIGTHEPLMLAGRSLCLLKLTTGSFAQARAGAALRLKPPARKTRAKKPKVKDKAADKPAEERAVEEKNEPAANSDDANTEAGNDTGTTGVNATPQSDGHDPSSESTPTKGPPSAAELGLDTAGDDASPPPKDGS